MKLIYIYFNHPVQAEIKIKGSFFTIQISHEEEEQYEKQINNKNKGSYLRAMWNKGAANMTNLRAH